MPKYTHVALEINSLFKKRNYTITISCILKDTEANFQDYSSASFL